MNFNNNSYRPGSFGYMPVVTKNIIIINVIMWGLSQLLLRTNGINLTDFFGLHDYRAPAFKPHQFITYIFMHDLGSPRHLIMNMLGVFVFGQALEQVWGPKRYLIFYLITGLGAAVAQYLILSTEITQTLRPINDLLSSPGLSASDRAYYTNQKYEFIANLNYASIVGASGSLFGLLGAFGMLFPNTELMIYFLFPIKAKWLVMLYGAVELYLGYQNNPKDPVAHFAHLAGLFVGIALVLIWRRDKRNFY